MKTDRKSSNMAGQKAPLTPEQAMRIGMETRMPGKAKGKARKKAAKKKG